MDNHEQSVEREIGESHELSDEVGGWFFVGGEELADSTFRNTQLGCQTGF